ncbi:hypothetical protein C2G38_2205251 [Gigaspora rosea]|uniref:Uncharacterized protein n=1 Tax=Gigaspora rosea TaxID=44941 RepID=A0A397UUB2_9GLOM|nr:hypothetical protein C2G38_2205251 [Gigaspora rosea]
MTDISNRRDIDLKTRITDTNIPYKCHPPKNNIINNKNNTLHINRDTYNPPRPPAPSITTSNYRNAIFMQRGSYDNVHQRCGDFVIDIEPYHPVTSLGGTLSYSTGGTATMTTNLLSQPSTTLFNPITSDNKLNKKMNDLESHIRYQSDQLKSILWERDDLKYRNHGLEAKIKILQDQINQSGQFFEECESLKNQNESLHNGVRQLQSMIVTSNKERDDVRGKYQLLELYLNQMQEKLSDNEKLVFELNEIKNQNNEIMLENKNLHEEVDRLRENGDELANNLCKLKNELSFFIKQHDDTSKENNISTSNPDQILEVEAELEINNEEEYKKLQDRCDELSGLIQNVTKERDNYFNQFSDLSSQMSRLETELNLTRLQSDKSTNNNNTLSSQLEQLQIKLDNVTQHRDEILNKNNTLTSQLGRVQDELNQVINQQKDKENSLIGDLTKELNKMKEQCCTLNEQHEELQRQNHDLTFEQERLQTENERLQTDLERMKIDSNNVVHQRDEFKFQNESIISEITMLKQQLEANKEMSVAEANSSQQTNEEFDNVCQRKDELSTENAALQAEVGRLRDLLDNLNVELERSRKGANDLMQQRDGFKSLNEALMSELSRIKQELDTEVRENYSPTTENINPHNPSIPPVRGSTYPISAPLTQSQQSHLQNHYSPSVTTQRNLPQQLIIPQPLATTSNGTSEYMNESFENSKSLHKSSSTISLPASPSQIPVPSSRTGYSEKINKRASMYNSSKPLPNLPTSGQGQRPKSFAFGLSNRKSLILPDKITSSQPKVPKQVPMCQHCSNKPCKKKFPKGYSKFCSSICKNAAQKDSGETASQYSQYDERRSSYSSSIFNGSTESFMKDF